MIFSSPTLIYFQLTYFQNHTPAFAKTLPYCICHMRITSLCSFMHDGELWTRLTMDFLVQVYDIQPYYQVGEGVKKSEQLVAEDNSSNQNRERKEDKKKEEDGEKGEEEERQSCFRNKRPPEGWNPERG